MPIADWLSYPPPLYINIGFGLSLKSALLILQIFSLVLKVKRIGIVSVAFYSLKIVFLALDHQVFEQGSANRLFGLIWSELIRDF